MPEFVNLNTISDGKPDPKSPLSASERARIKVTFQNHVGDEYVDFKYYSKPLLMPEKMLGKMTISTSCATLCMTIR